eukprot:gene26457-31975_t
MSLITDPDKAMGPPRVDLGKWPPKRRILLIGCPLVGPVDTALCLKIATNSLAGTETSEILTDKQLAIQRYFAELTFLNTDINNWDNWGPSADALDCDGNTCIRYEIAGLAYAAAIYATFTPAYIQVAEEIMFNSILRMTQQRVWQYVELFDDFRSQPTYPDPVIYKNIMFSGHLAQMILMFESVFGNLTFSTEGWDFVWVDSESQNVTTMHYTTQLLVDRVFQQAQAYGIGGVPCEPDSIFVICNNYPQNAWLLHDKLHNTNYSARSIPVWHNSVKIHGINRLGDKLENFFKLDFLLRPLGIWEPIGSIGSDMWALGWMKPWWPISDISNTLQTAFQSVLNSSCWQENTIDLDSQPTTCRYLHPSSQKIFPFDDAITSSFYPMVEKQFVQTTISQQLGNYNGVFAYFESQFAQVVDLDEDGTSDAFLYNTNVSSTLPGDYSIWATANLLIAMLHPQDDLDFLRTLVQHPQPLDSKQSARVKSVDYPHVMVAYARNIVQRASKNEENSIGVNNNLTLILKPGDAGACNYSHKVIISGVPEVSVKSHTLSVTLDGLSILDSVEMLDREPKDPLGSVQLQVTLQGWTDEAFQWATAQVLTVIY